VHRDLKSPNVLLSQDRQTLKISDFGTARKVGSRSLSEKTMCGSPPWMAPELIRNEPYGKTVDVWSYGVVLWELLTGEVSKAPHPLINRCFHRHHHRRRHHYLHHYQPP
jgi:serine/threonine protein kinase